MNKPYIICHMMTSVDGRIDCAMTEHLPGVQNIMIRWIHWTRRRASAAA